MMKIKMALEHSDELSSLLLIFKKSPLVFSANEFNLSLSTMNKIENPEDIISEFNKAFPEEKIAMHVTSEVTLTTIGNNGGVLSTHIFDDNEVMFEPSEREKGLLLIERTLRTVTYELNNSGEENIIKNDIARRQSLAKIKRDKKINAIVDIPNDFLDAIKYTTKKSSCFEEFKAILKNSMFDMSNRNLTRLGRATQSLDEKSRNNEDSTETIIYRALPIGDFIEEGDWVTTNEDYAQIHLEAHLNGNGIVLPINVRADEIYSTADEKEQIYIPKETWGECESLREVWDEFNSSNKPVSYPKIKARTLEEIQKNKESSLTY
jgi:hypothetical protein